MSKILITGSCGFILGNFVRRINHLKYPHRIVSVDRINIPNSIYWNGSQSFYMADVKDSHIINNIFQLEKPDIVIHGAMDYSNDIIGTNVLGTQNIIDACIKYKVEKLVYLSTYKVYGSLKTESDKPFTEDSILNPEDLFSATKVSAEMLIKAANKSHNLNYNIIRSSNNYGPRQSIKNLIPKTIKSIINNEKIQIYNHGMQMREWTHVADNTDAILTVIEKGSNNEIYNVSSGQELYSAEVIYKLCNIANYPHNNVENIEMNIPFRFAADSSKIKKLGWNPSYKFKDGIINVSDWFANNKWSLT